MDDVAVDDLPGTGERGGVRTPGRRFFRDRARAAREVVE
jgi:hypothetical protein